MIGCGSLGMRRLAFITVKARSGCQDELGHPLVAGILEHIQVAESISVEVAPGVGGAGAHTGDCCKVDNGIRRGHHGSQPGDEIAVGNVVSDEMKIRLRQKRLQAMFFHADVVYVVEVINPKDGVPLAQH